MQTTQHQTSAVNTEIFTCRDTLFTHLPKVQIVSSDCSRTEWYKRNVWWRGLNDMYENSTNCKATLWQQTDSYYRYTTYRAALVHFSCKTLRENHALCLLLLETMSLKFHTISKKIYGYNDRQKFQYWDMLHTAVFRCTARYTVICSWDDT